MNKFYTFLILLISIGSTSFGQRIKTNNAFVRVNGSVDYYTSVQEGDKKHPPMKKDGTLGFGLDIGGKHFLRNHLYIEEAVGFVFSKLPLPGRYLYYASGTTSGEIFEGPNPYNVMAQSGRYSLEAGAKINAVAGISFPIKNKMSIDLFAGPELRYIFNYKPDGYELPDLFRKTNLKVRTGVGFNFNNLNVILTVNPDLLDRAKGIKRYRTIQFGLGVGYNFR